MWTWKTINDQSQEFPFAVLSHNQNSDSNYNQFILRHSLCESGLETGFLLRQVGIFFAYSKSFKLPKIHME